MGILQVVRQCLTAALGSNPTTAEAMSAKQTFSNIYRTGLWGSASVKGERFFSGSGSHDPQIVEPYVEAVSRFLRGLDAKPSAVDLGCGDFNIGSRIRPLCSNYIAADIVDDLIERNKRVFADLDVDFRVLDMIVDDLPAGEVIFLRQVLQHLSNADIANVLSKIPPNCKYLIVTEHLPANEDFERNVDKARGHELRLRVKSGVVLTSAPFDLQVVKEEKLCEVAEMGGLIRTMAYFLR